jgi:hypothetical protein
VVLVGFLEKPPEVVRWWPHLTLVAAYSGQAAPHVGAAWLTIIAIGRGPLKPLLALVLDAFGALLGAMGGDVG